MEGRWLVEHWPLQTFLIVMNKYCDNRDGGDAPSTNTVQYSTDVTDP